MESICKLCNQKIKGKPYEWKLFEWSDDVESICLECHLEIEESDSVGPIASGFWKNYHDTHQDLPHICDYSIEELKKRHVNVLQLCQQYDPWLIGLLIAGELYDNVWSSRSCSGHLATLIGTNNYTDYYCGSSNYFDYMYFHPDRELLAKFKQAIIKDNKGIY